ncbi:MAG: hypothetical protein HKM07_04095, partial [Chlamydiae bacterium]|nr:hypothetical protein [Chlamydiota bacterium]
MKNCNEELLGELLLGTQTALADAVTPQLRAVIVDYDEGEQIYYGNFFYDGEAPEEVLELWSATITEASANIGAWDESRNICRIDYPNPIPDIRGRYAYYRKEPVLPNFKTEPRIASLLQKKFPLLACLKLDMQEILLGKVIPALRYILIEVVEEEKIIKLLIIYEGDN